MSEVSLEAAIRQGLGLLTSRPDLAEAQAQEILAVVPGHPAGLLIRGAARRRLGRVVEGLADLTPLVAAQPSWPPAHLELGIALGETGDPKAAVDALSRAVALEPGLVEGWTALAVQQRLLGRTAAAERAEARSLTAATRDPALLEAGAALNEGRLAVAEHLLRDRLKARPDDPASLRMLAETATRLGRYEDAEALLRRCLELTPGFVPARHNLAVALYRQTRAAEALAETEVLLKADPHHPGYRNLQAASLAQLGEYERAIVVFERLLADFPVQPKGWMSYGHALKTIGRQEPAVAAYRRAISLAPGLGEAWWSLANLKTFRFTPADLDAMRAALAGDDLSDEDRFHLDFALGKALEDAGRDEEAFAAYSRGNALRRSGLDYDAEETHRHVLRSRALFTPAFWAARQDWGCPSPDPIFILGLPRAGSTLVEQILASHPLVEGTMELPDMPALAKRLGARTRREQDSAYPDVLADLDADACRALGEAYLARTSPQRKTDRPYFIDKMPNNFSHVGLIRLILPRARIVDARRHPLGCCFSGFKQHFARGQAFTYDLTDLGRYYADYVALMAHFDAVLPGHVHRVIYEHMVADPETEVRSLLAYCGLDFDPACLRFYENDRAVRTASSEQVRRPIFTEGLDQWRRFEPWLGPLKAALGPVLETYPAAPLQQA
ncbi:MAG: tetratricopeptide repeat-containing sulfotransferase family protein [Curvibacter sp.]|uniref:tetratricopeptide repeat-containing sulfotransferase family protein n=1 Tax=Phenylobacterium sp. TaxID=1871053 RepID=UPI0025E59A1A|nr:tetratricopeptide repeat-containing sulfotransferase family protein [Phenylobacterium sp.]MCA3742234.1 sulfotransferase [Phenylobacterium sp.]MCA3755137.1 sulfotransferase [Phenylobacterium sp.]